MFKIFFRLNAFLDKKKQKTIWLLAFLYFLSPLIDLLGVSLTLPVLNGAIRPPVSARAVLRIAFLGVLFLGKGLFDLTINKISNNCMRDNACEWSVKIYELYARESLLYHNQRTVMQTIAGVKNDPEICAAMMQTYLRFVTHTLVLAGYFLVIIYLSGWEGVVCCILLTTVLCAVTLYNRSRIEKYGRQKRKTEIKLNAQIAAAYGSYKEMKIDSRSQNMLHRFQQTGTQYAQIQKEYAVTVTIVRILLQNVILSALFFLLAVLLLADIPIAGFLAEIVFFIVFLFRMVAEANVVSSAWNSLYSGRRFYEVFQENMERYQKVKLEEEKKEALRQKQITVSRGVRVLDLTFAYQEGKNILEHAEMEILPGKSTAIIGKSGVGKTTFLDLLLGLLSPQAGHIWYDDFDVVEGRDAQGLCRAKLGDVISYIPQTVYMNGESIRNNVAYMTEEGKEDEDRIMECLKCAQIWEDVKRMPQGMDTLIGDNGTTISNGQRQRIALARALYKNFDMLIMDEATAALDMDTESAILDSIRQMKAGKTLLLVTHHMNLANACDHIYKMENKKFVKVR